VDRPGQDRERVDSTGRYLTDEDHTGVWFSDRPDCGMTGQMRIIEGIPVWGDPDPGALSQIKTNFGPTQTPKTPRTT
jgi:hypothetical protein